MMLQPGIQFSQIDSPFRNNHFNTRVHKNPKETHLNVDSGTFPPSNERISLQLSYRELLKLTQYLPLYLAHPPSVFEFKKPINSKNKNSPQLSPTSSHVLVGPVQLFGGSGGLPLGGAEGDIFNPKTPVSTRKSRYSSSSKSRSSESSNSKSPNSSLSSPFSMSAEDLSPATDYESPFKFRSPRKGSYPFKKFSFRSPKKERPASTPSISASNSTEHAPKGPKVKAYIFQQTQGSSQKPAASDTCYVCDELLQNKLNDEQLLHLKCGDFIHGGCFNLTIQFEVEIMISEGKLNSETMIEELRELLFPPCQGKLCSEKTSKMIPFDKEISENLLRDALLRVKENDNLMALKSALNPSSIPISEFDSFLPEPNLSLLESPTPQRSVSYGRKKTATNNNFAAENFFVLRSCSSDSFRSISPAMSISTMNTAMTRINNYKNISEDALNTLFIKFLLNNCDSFSLNCLLKLGTLRLADYLLVSFDGISYGPQIVYLFELYLIVINDVKSIHSLPGTPVMLPLGTLKVSTPKSSILKISSAPKFQIYLSSKVDSIIEKWVVATSDLLFMVPSDIITSTIEFPELKQELSLCISIQQSTLSDSTLDLKSIGDAETIDSKSKGVEVIHNVFEVESDLQSTDSDSDSDSDSELIKIAIGGNSTEGRIDHLFKMPNTPLPVYDTDSEYESDQEIINDVLGKQNLGFCNHSEEWENLIMSVDQAIARP